MRLPTIHVRETKIKVNDRSSHILRSYDVKHRRKLIQLTNIRRFSSSFFFSSTCVFFKSSNLAWSWWQNDPTTLIIIFLTNRANSTYTHNTLSIIKCSARSYTCFFFPFNNGKCFKKSVNRPNEMALTIYNLVSGYYLRLIRDWKRKKLTNS